MSTLRFTAVIKIHGVNPYVLVSAARASKLKPNWRKPMPVLVRLNPFDSFTLLSSSGQAPFGPESVQSKGKLWRTNMMPIGDGSFRLYLNGNVRKASGTGVGDRVEVEVRFDAKYRSGPAHPIPAWFRAALRRNPVARKNWEALIPSRRKEILRYFAALKSPEARERNLARAMQALLGGPTRFMARSWSEGK